MNSSVSMAYEELQAVNADTNSEFLRFSIKT